MSTVNLTIDNRKVTAEAGSTVLEAARSAGIVIPTLCAWTERNHTPGACRVCMTEVEGQRSLIAACVFPVTEGMVVHTNTEKVRKARKMVVELLLARGADVNARENSGWTPLLWAANKGHVKLAEMLLARGADVNARANDGTTPLQTAACYDHRDLAQLLLASKANVNAKDANGNTPLHTSAYRGYKDVAELLLDNGADVDAVTNNGTTPLHWAVIRGHNDVAEMLRQHGGHDLSSNQIGRALGLP